MNRPLLISSWGTVKPVGGSDPGQGNLGGILGERYKVLFSRLLASNIMS